MEEQVKRHSVEGMQKPWLEELGVNKEGFLCLTKLDKKEQEILDTRRASRLILDEKEQVIGIAIIPTVKAGRIIEQKAEYGKIPLRDDLVEPQETAVNLEVYLTDLRLVSQKLGKHKQDVVQDCYQRDLREEFQKDKEEQKRIKEHPWETFIPEHVKRDQAKEALERLREHERKEAAKSPEQRKREQEERVKQEKKKAEEYRELDEERRQILKERRERERVQEEATKAERAAFEKSMELKREEEAKQKAQEKETEEAREPQEEGAQREEGNTEEKGRRELQESQQEQKQTELQLAGEQEKEPEKETREDSESREPWEEEGAAEKGKRAGTRAAIKEYTKKARNHLKFTLRNALCEWSNMITLTYPGQYPKEGKVCKKQLDAFLQHLRKDYKGLKYVWFLEFQKRGAPHFHIFSTAPVPGKHYTAKLWYHIVDSKDDRHLRSGTQVKPFESREEGIRYATEYANKSTQKMSPKSFYNVGRFWGASRGIVQKIATITDLSLRQIQQINREYNKAIGRPEIREDLFNRYLWGATAWAPRILHDYYEAHLRPLVAQKIEGTNELQVMQSIQRLKECANISGTDLTQTREMAAIFKQILSIKAKEGQEKQVKQLTELEASFEMESGPEELAKKGGTPMHSVTQAYEKAEPKVTEGSYKAAEIPEELFQRVLARLARRMRETYAQATQYLRNPTYHTFIRLLPENQIQKQKFIARDRGLYKLTESTIPKALEITEHGIEYTLVDESDSLEEKTKFHPEIVGNFNIVEDQQALHQVAFRYLSPQSKQYEEMLEAAESKSIEEDSGKRLQKEDENERELEALLEKNAGEEVKELEQEQEAEEKLEELEDFEEQGESEQDEDDGDVLEAELDPITGEMLETATNDLAMNQEEIEEELAKITKQQEEQRQEKPN